MNFKDDVEAIDSLQKVYAALTQEIHKKIKTEELHSDLQKALTKIKYLMADGDSRKVMLEDV